MSDFFISQVMYKSHCVYSITPGDTNFAVNFKYFNRSKHQVSLRDAGPYFKLFFTTHFLQRAAINICKLF